MSRKRRKVHDEMEPTKKLTSDGDLLLKSLLEKQLSTDADLQKELTQKKEFISSSEYVPISNLISGVTSLDALEDNSKYRVELDQLKRSGLNNGDINFYFDSKKGLEYLRLKHKNLDVPHIEQRLAHIHSSLETQRLKNEDNSDSLSTEKGRQKTEFMLSIKPNSKETNLLKFALDNEKKYNDHIPSALDGIKELEQEINNSLQDIQTPNFSHIRRKVRKMKRRIESIKPEISEPIINNASNSISFVNNSKWDMRVLESQQEQRKINGEKSYSCEYKNSSNLYTIKDGEIIKLNKTTNLNQVQCKKLNIDEHKNSNNLYTIKDGEIIKLNENIDQAQYKKLSIDEIKQIPKFAQYDPGIPTKTLYMKNLSSESQNDIENLFKIFNFKLESLNILKGRMRGQAFIEMENSVIAEKALNCLNGTIIRNKPLIIEFGRKK